MSELPSQFRGFTMEYDVKMSIATGKTAFNVLSNPDHKVEITFYISDKQRHYQTTLSDLMKILEDADVKYSQSRELKPV